MEVKRTSESAGTGCPTVSFARSPRASTAGTRRTATALALIAAMFLGVAVRHGISDEEPSRVTFRRTAGGDVLNTSAQLPPSDSAPPESYSPDTDSSRIVAPERFAPERMAPETLPPGDTTPFDDRPPRPFAPRNPSLGAPSARNAPPPVLSLDGDPWELPLAHDPRLQNARPGASCDLSAPSAGPVNPWLLKTSHVSLFLGPIWGDELIEGRVDMGGGLVGGLLFGADPADYWGWEGRLALASPSVANEQGNPIRRSADIFFADFNLHYYLWEVGRFRPFLSAGVGLALFNFDDDLGFAVTETVPTVPVGLGVKYLWNDRLALRFDLTDNLAIGDGRVAETTHNFSVTGGFDYRFGGPKRSYWPWNPSIWPW